MLQRAASSIRNGAAGGAARRLISLSPHLLCEDKQDKPVAANAARRKKVHYAKYGIDESNASELNRVYESRQDIDKWIYHPTHFNMISDDAIDELPPSRRPPGTGPVLRWETCMVFPYDGTSWHPRNRKVKLWLYVEELKLSAMQKRRLVDIVQRRYHRNTDKLTLVVAKYEDREDNRKEALRILYNLLEEAVRPMASLDDHPVETPVDA